MKRVHIVLLLLFSQFAFAQQLQPSQLSFNEFLGYVKKYHPVVRQANLKVSSAQAELMAARGAFDPKVEIDYANKEFKGNNYYSLLNSSFKIPTYYGIEVKAGFDNSEGIYVNPQNVTPNSGLTSVGINIPLGQGFLINRRMADLRTAKLQLLLSDAERKLQATNVLYDASVAYFNWKKVYDEVALYKTYLDYAEIRYSGVIRLIEVGDKPAIDSVEAGITVKNRTLALTEAQLKLEQARLEMSNYLWIDNVPVELAADILPEPALETTIANDLNLGNQLQETIATDNHPKIMSLQSRLSILDVERRFKSNLLLPRVDLSYDYLAEPAYFDNYRLQNYKVALNFSYPLFLRKERGSLRLAKLKIQDATLDLDLARIQLTNEILGKQKEIQSVAEQMRIINDLSKDFITMLKSEERLFSVGESSIFLINARENNAVAAQLSQIDMQYRFLISHADFFKLLSNPD